MSRRKVIGALGAALTVASVLTAMPLVAGASSSGPPSNASLKGKTLVITSWGGVWTQDEQKYWWGPFEKATGVKVESVINGSDPSIPALLQEQQNNVSIDLVEPLNPTIMLNKGEAENFPSWLLSTFKSELRSGTYTKNTIDIGNTADVIACNPAVMKKCPLTPAEFFDVKDYPGPRAIVDDPTAAIPYALEALGENPTKLFPLNISKGIAELQKIKSDISVWPSSGSQQQQVLTDKTVGAEILWNGRAYVVQQQNIPGLIISWKGALLPEPNGFLVPKGAPNADVAFAYLKWLADHPINQAKWTEALTYPTPAKTLASLIPKKVAAALPVGQKVTYTSNTWFAKNETALQQAWQNFLG
jgi:putative spermidine/putrescine transport system substrate-binding protein